MLVNEPCIANNAECVVGGQDVFLDEFDALLAISIAGLLSTLAWTKQKSCRRSILFAVIETPLRNLHRIFITLGIHALAYHLGGRAEPGGDD